ncbi:MAG: molybdopterin-dependent oxidoreductase [Candidatus Binatia bacterium]
MPPEAEAYGDWRDIYKEAWTWDRVVRGTHSHANCVSACAWNLYVRDGVVWREEQAGSYDEGCSDCPDFNPRGCQKGACASDLLLGKTRLGYPLKRLGPRGKGRWKRISWSRAIDETAEAIVDAVDKDGGRGLIAEIGPELDYGPHTAAPLRFFKMLGAPITDTMAMIGDVAFGGTITLGTAHTGGSSDDWFRSDYIVLWAFNPVTTRIPDAHFLTEARYRGARVVSIAPDYNPSSIHADSWIHPRPATDAALALSAVQVIIEAGLHDQDYLREQTDMPLLVRADNGRFLRAADVEQGGSESLFYAWDSEDGRLVEAPGSAGSAEESLRWEGIVPALEGHWVVSLAGGEVVEVEPVFSRLKRQLNADYRPERASLITGVAASTIRRFALDFARSRAALVLSQYGSCKFYHSDLIQRSQILLASVTGNIGRPGGGWRSGAYVAMEGMPLLAMQKDLGLVDLVVLAARNFFRDPEENLADFSRYFVPSGLWHYVHGGLDEDASNPAYGDPALGKGPRAYVREALDAGWFPVDREAKPTFMLSVFGNVLRHSRNGQRLLEILWPKLSKVVTVDFRLSQTGIFSDLVLPAAGWYEKVGFKYIPSVIPYVTLADRAVEPYGESKPEWEIFYLLAEAVARKARARGVDTYDDYLGEKKSLAFIAQAYSDDGRFGPEDEEKLADFILMVSSASRGTDLSELRESGQVRLKSLGQQGGTAGFYADYSEKEPVVPMGWFVDDKRPYPTLTGRQQFYVDHRWFLELGEELPRHKQPPTAGGAYPLTLSGGHTRWSIHAIWRDHDLMLRLQRGEPVVLLGDKDALDRGISDHDRVRVYNDISVVQARAKVVHGFPSGFATVYHAWEPHQFEGRRTHQDLSPAPLKVTQLAGDYGHLGWSYGHYEPGQVDRDTRVEIERVT